MKFLTPLGISIAGLIVLVAGGFSYIFFFSDTTSSEGENAHLSAEEHAFSYENIKYGFEVSFPSAVAVREYEESIPGPGGHVFRVAFGDEGDRGVIAAVTVSRIDTAYANGVDPLAPPHGMDPVSEKDIRLAGVSARVYNEGEDGTVFTVAKGAYQYMIYPLTREGGDALLTSFRFTD